LINFFINFKSFFQLKPIVSLRIRLEVFVWRLKLKNISLEPNILNNEKKNILIASTIGDNLNVIALDLVLGIALKSRGHNVYFLLCNKALPACMNCELNKYQSIEEFDAVGASKLCNNCFKTGTQILNNLSLPIIQIEKRNYKIAKEWDAEIANSGAKRFLAIGRIYNNTDYEKVLKRYFDASQVLNGQMESIYKKYGIDTVIAHHGIYVPQANIVRESREQNLEVITWTQSYRKQTFIFSRGDTYHKTLVESTEEIAPITLQQEKEIENYLLSRDLGKNDWIRFGISSKETSKNIFIGDNKRKVLLLTNVSWDAQLHYKSRIFFDMHDWIEQTIKWFVKHPELDLIIRIHPAEITGKIKSRDPILDYIDKTFSNLPKNIVIVGPNSKVSTYSLMEQCELGLIFATKAGIELAALGIPIIVAGESWIRGRGLSNDPKSDIEYFDLLKNFSQSSALLHKNPKAALAFAYYFFYRISIPIKSIKALNRYPYLRPNIQSNWDKSDYGLLKVVEAIETNSKNITI
jgi:hypothetical protein